MGSVGAIQRSEEPEVKTEHWHSLSHCWTTGEPDFSHLTKDDQKNKKRCGKQSVLGLKCFAVISLLTKDTVCVTHYCLIFCSYNSSTVNYCDTTVHMVFKSVCPLPDFLFFCLFVICKYFRSSNTFKY